MRCVISFLELHRYLDAAKLNEFVGSIFTLSGVIFIYASSCCVFLWLLSNRTKLTLVWVFARKIFFLLFHRLGLHLCSLYLMCEYVCIPRRSIYCISLRSFNLHNLLMVLNRHADEVLMWAFHLHQF